MTEPDGPRFFWLEKRHYDEAQRAWGWRSWIGPYQTIAAARRAFEVVHMPDVGMTFRIVQHEVFAEAESWPRSDDAIETLREAQAEKYDIMAEAIDRIEAAEDRR